ncbi:MAG: ABC transporter ATP-binding protein [Dehalococcoidales bacterium]|jgi:ABC-2 type transport system ATP-binding protein|nr:ABC transporter ATP-binding protein [Dehalococcoidales bacterium]MDD4322525.1 ABC transporter ATP-binding protein [Dehalococcoidales bacterium]MDD4794104.1 ABC transporter ATP-binding protein [Dehalococcoidales bacterium]MDD5121974.1 ABC transporter ATP-binding protein [Dehalococcoidales bacterium]MDD5498075.1 ABC transporter ATP-binding protein [Dehalococcoidales bacterium]
MPAISTDNLSKYYTGVKALDGLNMEVDENVIFGFLGPNGAGKTTAVKLLTGFIHPTKGSARVAGEPVEEGNLALQKAISLLPDVPAFYDWMNAREYLHFVAGLHQLSKNETKIRSEEMLELVGLKREGGRRIGGYSRGMRQRLGIAQALMNRPKVLFLDEPTSALDPVGKREVLDLIKKLKQTSTVFMSTHNLNEVERVCDTVGIINRGRLLTISSVEQLQKKYARSLFEMEFLEEASPFLETLRQTSWLAEPETISQNGVPVIRVKARDLDYARRELPRLISDSGLTLARYELVMPSLEDIFVEILSKEEPR